MVELSRKKLTKGCATFILKYKGKFYSTSSAASMKLFLRNPVLFEMVKLQDKLPI
jgi:YHS domain-containing protein